VVDKAGQGDGSFVRRANYIMCFRGTVWWTQAIIGLSPDKRTVPVSKAGQQIRRIFRSEDGTAFLAKLSTTPSPSYIIPDILIAKFLKK